MNKHDFYKQLMSEYTFDMEKIADNAKKGRFAKQKISPFIIGITAAVAVCTVACGTLVLGMTNGKNGIDLVDNGNLSLSALSSSERVKNAIEQQNKELNSAEQHDVLVTFTQSLPSAQAQSIIANYTDDSVPVKAVYLSDGSKVSGSEQVAQVFDGDYSVVGICIRCEGAVMSQLQAAPEVLLVELMTEADFDTVAPISPSEVEKPVLPDDKPDVSKPDVDDTPDDIIVIPNEDENGDSAGGEIVLPDDTTSGGTSESDPTIDDTTSVPEQGENTSIPDDGTSVPDDGTESVPSDDTVSSTEAPDNSTSVPDSSTTSTPEETEPSVPETNDEPAGLPDGVKLPERVEALKYEFAAPTVKNAYFLTDDRLVVITDDSISLYSFDGIKEALISSVPCNDPKVHWVDENGGRVIVSGTNENGNRNKLWIVDAASKAIFDLRAEETVMDGALVGVGYNPDAQKLIYNLYENGKYYICALSTTRDGYTSLINTMFGTSAKISLLGFNGNNVYLAVNDASLTQICAVDINSGNSKIIKTYDNNPVVSKNLAFTYGIISPSNNAITGSIEIFDPKTESFIVTPYFNESLNFGASKNSFCVNGSFYTISGSDIIPTDKASVVASIDYRGSFSADYAASVKNGCVYITDSIYSNVNRASVLYLGEIVSNADSALILTLNGAIGANNVLASYGCKQAGITYTSDLTRTLSVYYSESVCAQLKSICSIENRNGKLYYTNGGLEGIDISDTKLVISSSDSSNAAGTLYVSLGNVRGVPIYRTVDVKFVFENGAWKLDTIIGK